jgi:hypothetical protein
MAARYEFQHPISHKVTIRDKQTHKKIGEIIIRPASVEWKSGQKGAWKHYYVWMDDFVKWMMTKSTR